MRLIDADRALEIVRDQGIAHPNAYHLTKYATLILREAPTIEAEPLRHGRWVMKNTCGPHTERLHCSVCGKSPRSLCIERYCPNCGAKMDLEESDG